jgi:hypothetical protein
MTVRLNPAEARLRERPRLLSPVGRLAGHYKDQDEGSLGLLLSHEANRRRAEARGRARRSPV